MEKIPFTVDAGIINRLGLELVSKSETAVAELIKNAYDADANKVKLLFTSSTTIGGRLEIDDDGEGMDREKLVNGFLRLATTDKIHNSISTTYGRPKAGRKGIGRFSTQRLGTKLTIMTQTKESHVALKLTINWEDYQTDKEIQDIKNALEIIDRDSSKSQGTKLILENLRDRWSEADIKRVYRYVADLIQPNYLKVGKEGRVIEESKQESFEVEFLNRSSMDDDFKAIADPQIMLFDKALAIFTGYIDSDGIGCCLINSRSFYFNKVAETFQDTIKIYHNDEDLEPFNLLKNTNITFKAYYYIGGDRTSYYNVNKPELNIILDYLEKNGGIKLYRNGFIVSKYGNTDNDWLKINIIGGKLRLGLPFNTNRFIGFVQVVDPDGVVFEESAGREGLIEKEAFSQMQKFISISLESSFKRFASWFRQTDEYRLENPDRKEVATSISVNKIFSDLKDATKTLSNPDASDADKNAAIIKIEKGTQKLVIETNAAINELEMIRILAGTGIIIAEFIHEIKQLFPALKGHIMAMKKESTDEKMLNILHDIELVLLTLNIYVSYFDSTVSQNVVRDVTPINIRHVVRDFVSSIADINRSGINVDYDLQGHDLITCPMHLSEWNTILQNLFSNSKKAIKRAKVVSGKIFIHCYKQREINSIFIKFYDNGIGISKENRDRIFDAFFTTFPKQQRSLLIDDMTGTGLGLYIIKQIIKNRGGDIKVDVPIDGYTTCISIQLPLNQS